MPSKLIAVFVSLLASPGSIATNLPLPNIISVYPNGSLPVDPASYCVQLAPKSVLTA